MEPIIWVVLIMCAVAVFVNLVDIPAMLNRGERITKASGNAKDNVRVNNHRTGICCTPDELEPIKKNEMKVVIRNVDYPHTPYTLYLTREDLKHDPFETLMTGMINYWIPLDSNKFPETIKEMDQDSSSEHPVYTTDDLNSMNRELNEKLQLAEAKNRNLEANTRSAIDEGIENAALLSKSAKPNEFKR